MDEAAERRRQAGAAADGRDGGIPEPGRDHADRKRDATGTIRASALRAAAAGTELNDDVAALVVDWLCDGLAGFRLRFAPARAGCRPGSGSSDARDGADYPGAAAGRADSTGAGKGLAARNLHGQARRHAVCDRARAWSRLSRARSDEQ